LEIQAGRNSADIIFRFIGGNIVNHILWLVILKPYLHYAAFTAVHGVPSPEKAPVIMAQAKPERTQSRCIS
jgi:hypothetical protein